MHEKNTYQEWTTQRHVRKQDITNQASRIVEFGQRRGGSTAYRIVVIDQDRVLIKEPKKKMTILLFFGKNSAW